MGTFTAHNTTYIKKLQCTYNTNKIKMFAGNTLPENHVWCDGNNGTPNLKDRFIYGISSTQSEAIGNHGNSTISEMPSHSHSISKNANTTITKNITIGGIQRVNAVGPPIATPYPFDSQNRGNDALQLAHKDHTHNIDNSSPNILLNNDNPINKSYLQVEYLNPNSGVNMTFNDLNVSDSSSADPESITFDQKYILIGFIMEKY